MEYQEKRNICSECERKYEVFNKEPDCSKCPISFERLEQLDYTSFMALKIWNLVSNQVIMGMNGAVGLDISIVLEVIKLFGIEDREEILNMLMIMTECYNYYDKKEREKK